MQANPLASSSHPGAILTSLARVSNARSFSLSAENPTGGKGEGGKAPGTSTGGSRFLGQGWKVRPNIHIAAGTTTVIADIDGPGAIRHIWMTPTGNYRHTILRFYWDGEDTPSVEAPIGDFFASAYTNFNTFAAINSLAVCVNPGNAFNCYWEMPFHKHCRITVENLETPDPADPTKGEMALFYQIDGEFGDAAEDCGYFCAQFRRTNPLAYKDVYTIVDGIEGRGHYVGTYLAWQVNSNGWWGEGEIKFYLDGDLPKGKVGRNVKEHGGEHFPTICGTGTEDYFCGSYNFENKATKQYQEFTTAYAGLSHVVRPDGAYQANTRFSLYRWHLVDPVRFQQDLAVTIQALGWRHDGAFLPLKDDIASVAFWYQQGPRAPFPTLPGRDDLSIH
jgi:hypothetical protein